MNSDKKNFSLESLINPKNFQNNLLLDGIEASELIKLYESMLRIRLVEQKIASCRKQGAIGGPVHLGVGQEAVAVGVSTQLRPSDRVFGAHRSHAHILALGSSMHGLFAEVLGKNTGYCKGMGGSMHLWDQSHGFYGSVPIVSGTISLAVGAGLAAKFQKTNDISVAYFGDGAVEEGVTHESMNLARILNIPILFIVENNLFASHMHISQRQPKPSTARFAWANEIPYKIVDGNDVLAVKQAAKDLVDRSRIGLGPGFIEAVTYRWYGHVDWREDIDVGVNRSSNDVSEWRRRDPIRRLSNAMKANTIINDRDEKNLYLRIEAEITKNWQQALDDPYPANEELLKRVYKFEDV